mmetsp:Transcript_100399/g.199221  ORF Transcript_100399/g.199221 Transcript_100399/m.199221 type:complete len:978 (+) Transcript_100399:109-3042(+)
MVWAAQSSHVLRSSFAIVKLVACCVSAKAATTYSNVTAIAESASGASVALATFNDSGSQHDKVELQCSSKVDIFHIVLQTTEEKLLQDGPPNKNELGIPLPRSCERWKEVPNCCKDNFFQRVGSLWSNQESRLAAIRDAYENFVLDFLTPALQVLIGESTEARMRAVIEFLEKSNATEDVVAYIDHCEDKIRLHFAATTCELCDPNISTKLVEGKVMRVDEGAAQELWGGCEKQPAALEHASTILKQAADRMLSIENDDKLGDEDDDVPAHTEVVRARRFLTGAANAVGFSSNHIEFYSDKDQFLKELSEEGYVYQAKNWGWVDMMHPGVAQRSRSKPSPQKTETRNNKKSPVKRSPQKIGKLPKVTNVESSNTLAGPCVHGRPHESGCVCNPCWRGEGCEVRAKAGPVQEQPYAPLIAEDSAASPQSLVVVGCQMPQDISSQLARVRLVQVASAGSALNEVEDLSKDPCASTPLSQESLFQDLPLQIPVAATDKRLEYMVQVPQDSEGLYAVCFCQNADCHRDTSDWKNTGFVNVVRSQVQQQEDVLAKEGVLERGSEEVLEEGPELQPAQDCDSQWTHLIDESMTLARVADKVAFACKEGFTDLSGPREVMCWDGEWYVEPEDISEEAFENSSEHHRWNLQLPRCRWKYRNCTAPEVGSSVQEGTLELQDGIGTYTCDQGALLLLDANITNLTVFDRVRKKMEGQLGEVIDVHNHSRSYRVQWDAANDVQGGTNHSPTKEDQVPASQLELVTEEDTLKIYCQADGSWAPRVSVRCHKPAERDLAPVTVASPCLGTFSLPESSGGSLVECKQSAGIRHSPRLASLVEVGAAAASAETRKPATRAARQASLAAAAVWRHAAVAGMAEEDAASAQLQLHRWPVTFTKEKHGIFEIERCWMSWKCMQGGEAPPDTAAAASARLAASASQPGDVHSWRSVLAAIFLVALLVVCACCLNGSFTCWRCRQCKCSKCVIRWRQ